MHGYRPAHYLQSELVELAASGADWSLIVAVAALLFAVASFWWLYASRGSLSAGSPRTYAYAAAPLRLRLPLAFYNTGARALIVSDLRATALEEPPRPPLRWIATVSQLRPAGHNERDHSTPFAVRGRETREIVAEFSGGWCPLPGTCHRLRLEATLHPKNQWSALLEFEWWAPQPGSSLGQYLTYRNVPREQLPPDELPEGWC